MPQPKQKKVEYRGNTYVGVLRGGNVSVRFERTARGQNLIVGNYNVANNSWHDENRSGSLPEYVKREIEKAFA